MRSALDAFPRERQPLGYSDAYVVDRGPLKGFCEQPWSTHIAASVEPHLSQIRRAATLSEKIAAWRELTR